MGRAFDRLKAALEEAVRIAKGEGAPAAIHRLVKDADGKARVETSRPVDQDFMASAFPGVALKPDGQF